MKKDNLKQKVIDVQKENFKNFIERSTNPEKQ